MRNLYRNMIRRFHRGIVTLACLSALSVPSSSEAQTAVTMSLRMNMGHIFVVGRLNNSSPLWFELDSGSENAIDVRTADSLGLRADPEATVNLGGHPVSCGELHNLTLTFKQQKFTSQDFYRCDLSFISKEEGREVDGLIGANFLKSVVAAIDSHWRTLTFEAPAAFQSESAGQAIPLQRGPGDFFHVDLRITEGASTVTYSPELDTGSFYLVLPTSASHFAHGLPLAAFHRLSDISLGNLSLHDSLAYLSDGPWGNGLLGGGLLGTQTLRHFKIVLDFPHSRIFLQRSEYFQDGDEMNTSGMTFMRQGHSGYVINGIFPYGPAAVAGLRVGDTITQVNGRSASDYGLGRLWNMFHQVGQRYSITAQRGSESFTVSIVTKRLV